MTNSEHQIRDGVIGPHGGYKKLKSYQNAQVSYDAPAIFVEKYVSRGSRTRDQMEQAARSGKQNVAEASMASATPKNSELKLTGVARLKELSLDYKDLMRQRGSAPWGKEHPKAQQARKLAYAQNRTYETYWTFIEADGETAANTMICLIHQTNYLLDQQLRELDRQFREEGGFTEKLCQLRVNARRPRG